MESPGETAAVGIVAIGTYIPPGRETSREMSEKSGFPEFVFADRIGIREKSIAAPEEQTSDLGIRAAHDALERAQVDPAEVDLVLFCGCAFYDYGVWSPAARIQHAIGACNAFAYGALVVCSDLFSRLVNYADRRLIRLQRARGAQTLPLDFQ